MDPLPKQFQDRDALIAHVRALCPWADGKASEIQGGRTAAEQQLAAVKPLEYGRTRGFSGGGVTRLSPYIRHGVLSLNEVRNSALSRYAEPVEFSKFIQELAWRDYWQRVRRVHPQWVWHDVELYKTGFAAEAYADDLPDDIAKGKTGVACIDQLIRGLISTGYLHNHARLYIASYVVHFRRIKWQAGARWFLHHLLDGDPASNNFSWQWVASTFSDKPYIFNLENVQRFFGTALDVTPAANTPLDASYETLRATLFPNLESLLP